MKIFVCTKMDLYEVVFVYIEAVCLLFICISLRAVCLCTVCPSPWWMWVHVCVLCLSAQIKCRSVLSIRNPSGQLSVSPSLGACSVQATSCQDRYQEKIPFIFTGSNAEVRALPVAGVTTSAVSPTFLKSQGHQLVLHWTLSLVGLHFHPRVYVPLYMLNVLQNQCVLIVSCSSHWWEGDCSLGLITRMAEHTTPDTGQKISTEAY